jgi:hypothetical protein
MKQRKNPPHQNFGHTTATGVKSEEEKMPPLTGAKVAERERFELSVGYSPTQSFQVGRPVGLAPYRGCVLPLLGSLLLSSMSH